MEKKKYKPVPDVECLKYHGTPEKPDIKIFVSHRIDLDSETIDNPLYIPVRCGAVYDERENVTMLGDDTGDNISEKRATFNEFTVMYWAWKNIDADYYGLCHYRRFLSFYGEDLPFSVLRQGAVDSMSPATLQYYGFEDEHRIRKIIEETDIIVPYEYHMKRDAKPETKSTNIKDYWEQNCSSYLKPEHFKLLMGLIRDYAPQYYSSAVEFCGGKMFRGFNCFIMKKSYFFQMCEFIFPILFAFNEKLDRTHFSATQNRACGYLGEWLFSIYVYHLTKHSTARISERQLVAFLNTDRSTALNPAFGGKATTIVMPLNDGNRPLMAVTMQSLLMHLSAENNYDIIFLQRSFDSDQWCNHLKKQQNASLKELARDYSNVSVRFYDPKNELGKLDISGLRNSEPEELLYIYFVPWIFAGFNRVVWLQDGMLLNADVAELEGINIGDNLMAATKNPIVSAMANGYAPETFSILRREFEQFDIYSWASTEIAVLNLAQIRTEFSYAKIEESLLARRRDNSASIDINCFFKGRTYFLSQSWNHIESCNPEYFRLIEYIPVDIDIQSPSCEDARVKAFNLRGMVNSWVPQQAQTAKLFWNYARMTPFYEELLFGTINPIGAPVQHRSKIRELADRKIPLGSKRRQVIKRLLPKDSLVWKILRKIYYMFGGK